MSREIKFRAWDIVDQVMMYDNDKEITIQFCDGKFKVHYVEERHFVRDGIDQDMPCIVECTDFELMQFVGLKDKNGIEIYEGDINQDKGIVMWNKDDASFCWEYKEIETCSMFEENDWCEIIGNIYENPELIK